MQEHDAADHVGECGFETSAQSHVPAEDREEGLIVEFIHLTGTEDVRRAASTMAEAAGTIQGAMSGMEWERQQLSNMLDEKLERLEDILKRFLDKKSGFG